MNLEGEKYDMLAGFAEYAAMGIIEDIRYWLHQGLTSDQLEYYKQKPELKISVRVPDEIVEAIRNGKDAHDEATYEEVWALVADALDKRVLEVAPPVDPSFA